MALSNPLRRRPRRGPRIRYANDDSDSDVSARSEAPSRPSRSVRRVPTYRESSDESPEQSEDEDDSDASSEEVFLSRGTRTRPTRQEEPIPSILRKRTAPPRTGPAAVSPFTSYKRQKSRASDTHSKPVAHPQTIPPLLSSNQHIPPWQQLPYHILVSIMKYAAYPLYGQASRSNPSINWLCATSLLSRSFHEACIAALLYSPPLYPAWRAHGLIRLLESPSTSAAYYKRCIHYLDIEVKQLLFKKSGISLDELLSHTPLLQGMRLYSNHDDFNTLIWAQPTAQRLNWSYPTELFDHLDKSNIILRSFEWNGRFPSALEALDTAMRVHSNASFTHLRHLTFVNLTLPEKAGEVDVDTAHSLLAGALKYLPDLKSLSFRNCALLDENTASMLPIGLQDLELSHCSRLTSETLEQYLHSGGTSLRTLKLFGNQSMSLGFMASVQALCPRLQVLEVDMLYIDPTSYRDRDPLYDELLPNGPPTWPTDLVTVSVENLRQLSAADAEEFFASLVDSSEHLPYLRKLNIKAILKGASWRDRANLRKTWLPKLEATFLSCAEPSNVTKKSFKSLPVASQRQSSRIANSHLRKLSGRELSDDSDSTTPKMVQPRCEIVNLVISDQRPSQDQFHEEDFLDDEPSDDGEWNGRDTETLGTGYAW